MDGKEYKPSHGTVRNKFNEFTEKGIIELDYKTNIALYTLKGNKFGKKLMTPNHTGVSHNHPVSKLLENLVLDKTKFSQHQADVQSSLTYTENFQLIQLFL